MSSLEQRYRTALRWYPGPWRMKNEEVVLGTLLDKAEGEGRAEPRLTELANLAANGVANHLRLIPSAIPSTVRDRASTAALAVGTAIALTAAMQLEGRPDRYMEFFGREYALFGPFASPAIIVYAAWIAAFFASIAGYATVARWITVTTIPLAIGSRVLADANDMFLRPSWTFLGLILLLSLVVLAGSPAPSRVGVRWLLAWFLPALFVFTLPQTIINRGGFALQDPLWLDRPDLLSWSPVITVAVAVTLQVAGQRFWSAAVLLVGVPFTAAAVFGGETSIEAATVALPIALAVFAVMILLRAFGFSVRIQRVATRAPKRR
jgi:hypothetical protein